MKAKELLQKVSESFKASDAAVDYNDPSWVKIYQENILGHLKKASDILQSKSSPTADDLANCRRDLEFIVSMLVKFGATSKYQSKLKGSKNSDPALTARFKVSK